MSTSATSMTFGYYSGVSGEFFSYYVPKTYTAPAKQMTFSTIDERINAFKSNRNICEKDLFPNAILMAYKPGGIKESAWTIKLFGQRVVIFTLPFIMKDDKHLKSIIDSLEKIMELNIGKVICIGSQSLEEVEPLFKGYFIEYWSDNTGGLTDKLGEGIDHSGKYTMNRTVRIISNMQEEWYQKEENPVDIVKTHPGLVITYLEGTFKEKPEYKQQPTLPFCDHY